jgi:transposase
LIWSFLNLVARNLFALVWLLARPRRSKELEILVLRHEPAILRRQAARPKLTRADRALLAALSRSVPRAAWPSLPVKPETLLGWHRQLVARRWTYPQREPGRPPLERSLRTLVLRLARENPHWGYRRIVGELKAVGVTVSATSVRKVLLKAGLAPVPQRGHTSWRAFLRQQATSVLACDSSRRDRVPAADLRPVPPNKGTPHGHEGCGARLPVEPQDTRQPLLQVARRARAKARSSHSVSSSASIGSRPSAACRDLRRRTCAASAVRR